MDSGQRDQGRPLPVPGLLVPKDIGMVGHPAPNSPTTPSYPELLNASLPRTPLSEQKCQHLEFELTLLFCKCEFYKALYNELITSFRLFATNFHLLTKQRLRAPGAPFPGCGRTLLQVALLLRRRPRLRSESGLCRVAAHSEDAGRTKVSSSFETQNRNKTKSQHLLRLKTSSVACETSLYTAQERFLYFV